MSSFSVQETTLAGLNVVQRQSIGDARGFLARLFCAEELLAAGWQQPVAQINHTLTRARGSVRGMHYQLPPHAETKLVSCINGEVWDVAVDLRVGSATFLQWHAERLSAQNLRALLIPAGFAHGFQALSDDAQLLYLHSQAYAPAAEAGLQPQDPRLGITWPLPVTGLSERDAARAALGADFEGVRL